MARFREGVVDPDPITGASYATNICVLYTANDAHMRGYEIYVPADCTASNSPQLTAQALEHLRLASRADTRDQKDIDLETLRSLEG